MSAVSPQIAEATIDFCAAARAEFAPPRRRLAGEPDRRCFKCHAPLPNTRRTQRELGFSTPPCAACRVKEDILEANRRVFAEHVACRPAPRNASAGSLSTVSLTEGRRMVFEHVKRVIWALFNHWRAVVRDKIG